MSNDENEELSRLLRQIMASKTPKDKREYLKLLHHEFGYDKGKRQGEKELLKASGRGDVLTVKTLLEAGVSVGTTDELGNTALHKAALEGRMEVVRILMAAGGDPQIKNKRGMTAVDAAEKTRHLELLPILRGEQPPEADPS